MVVADGRVLNGYSLQVNESSLTGESTSVDKAMKGLIEGEYLWRNAPIWSDSSSLDDLWGGVLLW